MEEIVIKIGVCLEKFEIIGDVEGYGTKVDWFNDFCKVLSNLLISTANHIKNSETNYIKEIKTTILLYLTQLTTLLSLLIKIFLTENELKENINEARNFVIKQLKTCFEGLLEILKSGSPPNQNNSFLKFMDLSLDKLSRIDVEADSENSIEAYREAKGYIEEVLCHAMSIAQVASVDDSKTIKGGCKAVLEELESLFEELTKDEPKINFCNLYVDCCYEKLCSLEKKVNFAVLRLSLKVFSRYTQPIKALNSHCLNRDNLYNEEKLDDLVADLDQHVDEIMQIGLFALTASGNLKTAIQMKSCLASLEALEGELVPSFNRLLLDPNLQNKNYSYILEQFWIQQAKTLRDSIYGIVDPFTFCQVVYEELKQHVDYIDKRLSFDVGELNSKLFEKIVQENQILVDLIMISIAEMNLDNKKDVEKNIAEIKIILHETKSANTLLLSNKCQPELNNIRRVFKRVKILKGSVRKLLINLSKSDVKTETSKIDEKENRQPLINDFGNDEKLERLFEKGQELLNNRSILYKTPKKKRIERKCQTTVSKQRKSTDSRKPMSLLKTVHLRNMQFSYSKRDQSSAQSDLQITDILNDLENISKSFSDSL